MKKLCGLVEFQNEQHWTKFLHTVGATVAVFNVGWVYGLLGPSLPDLQHLSNTDLQQVSLLLTLQGVGRIVGGITMGLVLDSIQRHLLLLSFLSCFAGLAVAALPWSHVYPAFLAVFCVYGFCIAGIMTGSNAKIAATWGRQGRRYMQFLHFSYAFGGVISPLVESSFLAKPHDMHNTNGSGISTACSQKPRPNWNNDWNTRTVENDDSRGHGENMTCIYPATQSGKSRIFIPYGMAGGLFLVASAVLLFLVCASPSQSTDGSAASEEPTPLSDSHFRSLNRKLAVVCLLLVAIVRTACISVEFTQHSYLTTFTIRQLGWSTKLSAILSSVLWAGFALGRFSGIFLAKCLSPTKMIYLSLTGLCLTSVGQFAGGYLGLDSLLWIFIPLSSMSVSIFSPSLFTWVNENIMPLTGKVASFIVFTTSLGIMTAPLYVGFLIDYLTPMWYVYIQGIESLVAIVFFTVLVVGLRLSHDPERQPLLETVQS